MNKNTEKIKSTYQVSLYIHLGVMASLLIYIALVEIFGMKLSPYSDQSSYLTSMRYIFYGITIVVIFAIRRITSLYKLKPITGTIEKNLNRMLRISVITSLLCEIPALLGLVYFLVKGIKKDFYYLVILSAVLLLLYFPRYSSWESLAEREE